MSADMHDWEEQKGPDPNRLQTQIGSFIKQTVLLALIQR